MLSGARWFGGMMVVVVTGACATVGNGGGPPWDAPPPPADHNVYACALEEDRDDEQQIGPGGGNLVAGAHRLNVPSGALRAATRLAMREHASEYIVVSLRPAGHGYGQAATLVMRTERCGRLAANRAPLGIVRRGPGAQGSWSRVPEGTVEQVSEGVWEVRLDVEGHSSYALVAP